MQREATILGRIELLEEDKRIVSTNQKKPWKERTIDKLESRIRELEWVLNGSKRR